MRLGRRTTDEIHEHVQPHLNPFKEGLVNDVCTHMESMSYLLNKLINGYGLVKYASILGMRLLLHMYAVKLPIYATPQCSTIFPVCLQSFQHYAL